MTLSFAHEKLVLNDRTLAYRQDGPASDRPGVLFLPGFFSDMTGTKASFLADRCTESGIRFTRFDYRGHGLSSGAFIEGCISDWLEDALAVFDKVTTGPQIIVGSSMGGWVMLLLALRRVERIKGLAGIAAAPDFTEDLVWRRLSPAQRAEMQEKGVIYEPSAYGEPLPYTLKLVEDGRKNLLLEKPAPFDGPVRLIQGMLDDDVPWGTALRIISALSTKDARVTLIKDGDHRLSRPQDLDLLWQEVKSLLM
jgi:pimeloyl-ACP methyl ester carboxylesterase